LCVVAIVNAQLNMVSLILQTSHLVFCDLQRMIYCLCSIRIITVFEWHSAIMLQFNLLMVGQTSNSYGALVNAGCWRCHIKCWWMEISCV